MDPRVAWMRNIVLGKIQAGDVDDALVDCVKRFDALPKDHDAEIYLTLYFKFKSAAVEAPV